MKVDQIAGLAYRSQDRMIQQTPQGGGHPDDHEHEKGKEKTRQLHQAPIVGRGGTVKRQAQGQDSDGGRDGNGKAGCPMRLKVSARLSDREKGGGHSQKEGEGAGVGSVIDAGGIVIGAIEKAGLQHGQKGQEDQKAEADPPQAEFPDPRTKAVEQKQKQGPDEIVLEGQPQKPEVGKRGAVGETGEVAGVLGNLPEVVKAKEDSSHPLWKVLCLALIAVLTVGLSFLDRKLSALPLSGGSRHLTRRRIYPALLLVCLLLCALQWKISGRAIAAQAKDQAQMEEELKSQQQQQDQRNADAQGDSNQADASRKYSVTAIGDSVLLDASSALSDQIPGIYVDGKVSRQAWAVKDLINSLKEKNLLGNIIILHLGTNGAFRRSVGQEIIDQLGSDRQIYWVTVYAPGVAWAAQSNATIKALAGANSNVHLIDWANYAKGHRSWFFSDGIHLKPEGQKAYADLIKTSCGL